MASQWTPERRAKQAAAIHAWQPWKRATGPRSKEGKAKASRNAYAGAMRLQLRELGRALREVDTGFRALSPVTGPPPRVGARDETTAQNRQPVHDNYVNAHFTCTRAGRGRLNLWGSHSGNRVCGSLVALTHTLAKNTRSIADRLAKRANPSSATFGHPLARR